MFSTGILLCLLVIDCKAVANEELSRFLSGNGLTNLEPTFQDQEIEVRQIPGLTDNLLVDLGVRTIGGRLRIRSAASQWLQAQVFVCFVNSLKHCLFSLPCKTCCQFLLQQGGGAEVDSTAQDNVEVEEGEGEGGGGDGGEGERGE